MIDRAKGVVGVVAWMALVHGTVLTPVAHAHGENMLVVLQVLLAAFVGVISLLLLFTVRGSGRDRLTFICAYTAVEVLGISMSVGGGNGAASALGGWIFGLGVLAGPIGGAVWISRRQKQREWDAEAERARQDFARMEGSQPAPPPQGDGMK